MKKELKKILCVLLCATLLTGACSGLAEEVVGTEEAVVTESLSAVNDVVDAFDTGDLTADSLQAGMVEGVASEMVFELVPGLTAETEDPVPTAAPMLLEDETDVPQEPDATGDADPAEGTEAPAQPDNPEDSGDSGSSGAEDAPKPDATSAADAGAEDAPNPDATPATEAGVEEAPKPDATPAAEAGTDGDGTSDSRPEASADPAGENQGPEEAQPTGEEGQPEAAEPTEAPLALSGLAASRREVSPGETVRWSYTLTGADGVAYAIARSDGAHVAAGRAGTEGFDWTPRASGIYTLTVTAAQDGRTVERSASVVVRDGRLRVDAKSLSRYAVAGRQPLEFALSVSGGVEPYMAYISIEVAGQAVYVDDQLTGKLRYMPASFGTHTLKLVVADAEGARGETAVSVPVAFPQKESAAHWEATLPRLAGNMTFAEKLIAIARSQLGYGESTVNFTVGEDGKVDGYTRYGDWYGMDYAEWCAMFVSFCLHYAGITEDMLPYAANNHRWKLALGTRYIDDEDNYTPAPGDIVYFHHNRANSSREPNYPNHVGIVTRVDGATIGTIEGNSGNAVRERTYLRSDSSIVGYVSMAGVMALYDPNYEPPMPAVTLIGELADGVAIAAQAPEGALPEGVALAVEDCDVTAAAIMVVAELDGGTAGELDDSVELSSVCAGWRIGFALNGKPVEPEDGVCTTISGLPVDRTALGGDGYQVWQVDGGSVRGVALEAEGADSVTFEQRGSAAFAVTAAVPQPEAEADEP